MFIMLFSRHIVIDEQEVKNIGFPFDNFKHFSH